MVCIHLQLRKRQLQKKPQGQTLQVWQSANALEGGKMKCGRGLIGFLLCKHKGTNGECQKLEVCEYAENDNDDFL